MRFPLGIRFQALAPAPAKRVVQDKVQCQQIRRFVAIYFTKADLVKVLFDTLWGKYLTDQLVTGLVIGDYAYVTAVTFVTATCVCNLGELNFHALLFLLARRVTGQIEGSPNY